MSVFKVIKCRIFQTITHKRVLSRFLLVVAILTLLPPPTVSAQDYAAQKQVFEQAAEDFRSGRIDQSRQLLTENLSGLRGRYRVDALRLIALGYLARFDDREAERYTAMMLQENPYYSITSQDPPTFVDMVNKIKTGMTATVTTASNLEESLAEVPVPTTLITEEMIHDSGARNLLEVLTTFVPGMNVIDCNADANIVMRNIYSYAQDKILIMLNGHRLNSYYTNEAAPNFSISLEKIRQIEVLRGPASSVYGDVALTAVVNIITKQGADVNGIDIKAAAGNYGQLRGDVVVGKRYYDLDILAWASAYGNKGEKREVNELHWGHNLEGNLFKEATIGWTGEHPSYDIGAQLKLNGWHLLYNWRFSQTVAPYTLGAAGDTYDHGRYRTFNGMSPSYATGQHHAELGYSHQAGPIHLSYAATFDQSDVTRYHVVTEAPDTELASSFQYDYENGDYESPGLFKYVNGKDENYGLQAKASYSYQLPGEHKGSLTVGTEFQHFHLKGMRYQVGYNYEYEVAEMYEYRERLLGRQNSANASVQLKHQWRSLILNAGLRYDHKHRYDDTSVNELSPRVSLILIRPKWNMKINYSKSFVDIPFSTLAEDEVSDLEDSYDNLLRPERLYSWQLSFGATNWLEGLYFEVNAFYNKSDDLLAMTDSYYTNDRVNHAGGAELMASYLRGRFKADFNLTWMVGSEEQDMFFANEKTIPTNSFIMSNVILAWQATSHLRLHTHLRFEDRQYTYYFEPDSYLVAGHLFQVADQVATEEEYYYYNDLAMEISENSYVQKEIPARAIVNLGAEYRIGPVTLGLNVRNLFDRHYSYGGMNTPPIPQQGRWWTVSAACQF